MYNSLWKLVQVYIELFRWNAGCSIGFVEFNNNNNNGRFLYPQEFVFRGNLGHGCGSMETGPLSWPSTTLSYQDMF